MPCDLAIRLVAAVTMFLFAEVSQAQERVSFPTQDGGLVYGDLYGKGDRGIVLAHGGRFTKESWEKQARMLAAAGFRILAVEFRGEGQSHGRNRRTACGRRTPPRCFGRLSLPAKRRHEVCKRCWRKYGR